MRVSALLLLLLSATPAISGSFDGAWQGKLHFDQGTPANAVDQNGEMRIDIRGIAVHIFPKMLHGQEFMADSFHIAPMQTNAVIYGTHSDEKWVESWAFALTQKDADTLLFGFTRVVNNRSVPLSNPISKFSIRGSGEFKRVKSP